MSRYTGPSYKKARRVGFSISETGKELARRSYGPGQHGADRKGNKYYLGVCDYEGTYKKFISLGAKKYAYIDSLETLNITVAGVGKSIGAIELAERGGLDAFKEGFTFYKAGGTESVYNDDPKIKEINIEGHKLQISSNVLLRQSTYTLGITGEYARILENPVIWLALMQ